MQPQTRAITNKSGFGLALLDIGFGLACLDSGFGLALLDSGFGLACLAGHGPWSLLSRHAGNRQTCGPATGRRAMGHCEGLQELSRLGDSRLLVNFSVLFLVNSCFESCMNF